MWRETCRSSALTVAAAATLTMLAGAATADVLEVGPDGAVTVYDRPAVFTPGAVQNITPSAPTMASRATLRRGDAHAPQQVARELDAAAAQSGVSPALVRAVAWQESRFHPEATSSAGAMGVMQLMPGTARLLGVDPHDLHQNIQGGARYLQLLMNRFDGDLSLALAAYNAGPGAVARYGAVPPYRETQRYVSSILERLGTGVSLNVSAEVLP
jgi:soluble lytic murein transglycosylase-like protein